MEEQGTNLSVVPLKCVKENWFMGQYGAIVFNKWV